MTPTSRQSGDDQDPTAGLPDDLKRVLRDQSIVVSQDGAVFALIAEWQNAPSNTATADLRKPSGDEAA